MTASERSAYRDSGVDVEAGERAVELMRKHVDSTRRPESVGGLGGFGGAFSIPAGYREPLMMASTDGVGTKTVDRGRRSALRHHRHRPRRDVRRRCGVHRRRAARVPRLSRRRAARPRRRRGAGRWGGGRLSRGRRRAGRRRDGRAPRRARGERVRPRRVLHRRRRAVAGHRRQRGRGWRRRPGPGLVRASRERLLPRARVGCPVGPGPRRAVPGPPASDPRRRRDRRCHLGGASRDAGDARGGAPHPDPDLCAGRASGTGRRRRRRSRSARSRPHHGRGTAGQRASSAPGRVRRPPGPRRAGACRPSCA